MLLIHIHILDTNEAKQLAIKWPSTTQYQANEFPHSFPIVSFHKYDKILALDLYGDLLSLALRPRHCKSPYRSTVRILYKR